MEINQKLLKVSLYIQPQNLEKKSQYKRGYLGSHVKKQFSSQTLLRIFWTCNYCSHSLYSQS